MHFYLLFLASLVLPALSAPTPDSELVARGGIHCEHPYVLVDHKCVKPTCKYDQYYDEYKKACVDNPKPVCKDYQYYDEHKKACVDKPKPTCKDYQYYDEHKKACVDKPKPTCKHDQVYDEHKKACVDKPKPECPKGMRFNPSTWKCYSPARHPSVDNCAYLGKKYNAHENTCYDPKPEPPKTTCPKGMIYNPKTYKCFNPAKHPSYENCKYIGQLYNPHEKVCYYKPHCEKHDEYYDEHKMACVKKTW